MLRTLLLMLVLGALAIAWVFWLIVFALAQPNITETWMDKTDAASRWQSQGLAWDSPDIAVQDGVLDVTCYSCGLLYRTVFPANGRVVIEGSVRAEGERFWAALKLGFVDVGSDDDLACQYGNIALAHNVWQQGIDGALILVDCTNYGVVAPIEPWRWYSLKVVWDYGLYSFFLDGQQVGQVSVSLYGYMRPKLECVAAAVGGSGSERAHCQFGPVTMTGGIGGDVDGDGQVTAVDALHVLRHVVGLETVNVSMGDMDGDGDLDAGDALIILRHVSLLQMFADSL